MRCSPLKGCLSARNYRYAMTQAIEADLWRHDLGRRSGGMLRSPNGRAPRHPSAFVGKFQRNLESPEPDFRGNFESVLARQTT